MSAITARFAIRLRAAGAWRWLLILLLVLLVVPLPAGAILEHAKPAASRASGSASAIAVRYALDQLGKPYQWGASGPQPTTAPV